MKQLFLLTVLLAGLPAALYAQTADNQTLYQRYQYQSKTDKTFNLCDCYVNIRDFVTLKSGRMILELNNVSDYKKFQNIDTMIADFLKDISFYKDSLDNGSGSVRIDYAVSTQYDFKKLRFKKYSQDGDIYINRNGETSRLKLDEDTIRFIIQTSRPTLRQFGRGDFQYAITATFILDNYSDLNKVLREKETIHHALDTLASIQSKKTIAKPNKFPSTSYYKPYVSGLGHLTQLKSIAKNGDATSPFHFDPKWNMDFNIGAGLVRNTISPTVDLGIQYRSYWRMSTEKKSYSQVNLYVSPYFFFNKNSNGNYSTFTNWFLNADIGSFFDSQDLLGLKVKKFTVGAGYLIHQDGDYFKRTTIKAFASFQLAHGITLVPEVIFANSFKQIFPGVTVKVF